MTMLYGIKSCDTCRKAMKALEQAGHAPRLRDIRADPLQDAEIKRFLAAFGGALLNTRSTTWRGLSDEDRTKTSEDLLSRHPTLMKRPVIDGPGGLTLGWSPEAQSAHLGSPPD